MPHGDCRRGRQEVRSGGRKAIQQDAAVVLGHPDQQSLWPTTIQFSDEFYRSLEQHACRSTCGPCARFPTPPASWTCYSDYLPHYPAPGQTGARLEALKEQFGEGFNRDGRSVPSWPMTWPACWSSSEASHQLTSVAWRCIKPTPGCWPFRPRRRPPANRHFLEYQGITSTCCA